MGLKAKEAKLNMESMIPYCSFVPAVNAKVCEKVRIDMYSAIYRSRLVSIL
jgi:hypothetical protein